MPALIAGGAVIGGSILEGLFSKSSAKTSMSFQREMAQKAHQYEVADLRAAGLNPILSGLGGKGASASGGAMPSTPNFSGAASATALIAAQVRNVDANTRYTNSKSDIIGTGAGVGSDVSGLYNYIKEKAPSSAKQWKQLWDDIGKKPEDLPGHGQFKPQKKGTVSIQMGKDKKYYGTSKNKRKIQQLRREIERLGRH